MAKSISEELGQAIFKETQDKQHANQCGDHLGVVRGGGRTQAKREQTCSCGMPLAVETVRLGWWEVGWGRKWELQVRGVSWG